MRPIAFLLGTITALMGCNANPFPPEYLVERLRILGVRAEPPETDPSGEVELKALVADPQGAGRELRYTFAACAIALGYEAGEIPCPGPAGLDLPSQGASARLSLPAVLAWLAEKGLPLDNPPGSLVVPDTVQLLVGMRVEADNESIQAIKRITVRLKDGAERNRNPVLTALDLEGQPLPDTPWELVANRSVTLQPRVADDSRQSYVRPGETQERREDHLFAWFVSRGGLEDQRTILGFDDRSDSLDTNRFTAPMESGPLTLWLVVHDGRFGTDWLVRSLEIVPAVSGLP